VRAVHNNMEPPTTRRDLGAAESNGGTIGSGVVPGGVVPGGVVVFTRAQFTPSPT
jgi:hypothetical protein